MTRPLRFGLIGCGFFAQNHLNAWAQMPEVELVATCDIDSDCADSAAAAFGGTPYTDAAELLARGDLDFVDIATTPPTHRMMVELAAEAGVPAICQKPLAWDMDDAKAMVHAMASRNLPFMVHENFRFQYPMRRVKEVLDSGEIGRPFFARISFRSDFDVYANQPWCKDAERMIIADVSVHQFDLTRFFLGEPTRLFTEAIRVNPEIRGEDVATVLLQLDGATCIVDTSYESRSDHSTYPQTFVTIEGTDGTVTLGPDYHLQVVTNDGVRDEALQIPQHSWSSTPWDCIQDSVVNVQRHWVECLTTGRAPETSGADTLRVLDLTLGAYESLETALPYSVGRRL